MVPLDILTKLSSFCADRPFALLKESDQKQFLKDVKTISSSLKKGLEDKKLTSTQAYRIVSRLDSAVSEKGLDEVVLASAISDLDELYGKKTDEETLEKVHELDRLAERFRKRAFEFHHLEEKIKKATKKLSAEQIAEHDKTIMKTVGFFYVLEYTATIQQEMEKRSAPEQEKLLTAGLTTKVGNLPGLLPLVRSLRQEFAFQLYDRELRWDTLKTFFDLETQLSTGQISEKLQAIRAFNASVVRLAQRTGITEFIGIIYKPFPDRTSLQKIIDSYQF